MVRQDRGQNATRKRKRPSQSTPFQKKVYNCVRLIPLGKVATYATVAEEVSSCARAVGGAMRRNTFNDVPWHRVVASKGRIGGFSGQWGKCQPNTDKKYALLRKEGVKFDDKGYVAIEHMFYFGATQTKRTKTPKKPSRKRPRKGQKEGTNSLLLKNEITADIIKKEILEILQHRAPGKTCWPSEIPRNICKRPEFKGVNWRDYMNNTRTAARDLVRSGLLNILQRGRVINEQDEFRGPIRLQLRQ